MKLLPALLLALQMTPPAAPLPPDPETLRQAFLARFNQERQAAGLPPLVLVDTLTRIAQETAEDVRKSKAAPFEERAIRDIRLRIARAGYEAHGWSYSFAVTPGDVEEVYSWWKTSNADATERLLDPDYREIGIGVGEYESTPLYTFLFAWRESEYFARQTEGLTDLKEVRRAMLARVNAERAQAGVRPLSLDPSLNAAAQAHAEDMLARSYYNHESPEGKRPRDRVQAQGYLGRTVGENIARGALSVDEAVDGWLRSTEHRRNLLHGGFIDLGVGLAVGKGTSGYTAVWVQNFGAPQGVQLP
ncbi:MAG TPA: CAP domain-containing protein [Thermoanaerobaculia bacterium]|nr:CAP domain-containing protein [Thermoanaerobaculia bacterium]